MNDAPDDKREKLIETLKKTGLAANDADAQEIVDRMLTKREVETKKADEKKPDQEGK